MRNYYKVKDWIASSQTALLATTLHCVYTWPNFQICRANDASFKIPEITTAIFHTILEVRISDINYGNHLGHDSLISLLHEARVRFLTSLGFTELSIDGAGILVTSLAVKYISESFYADKIIINIEPGETTRASMDLIYQVVNQDTNKEVARALTTMTFYDYQRSKVCKIPQKFLTILGIDN